MEVVIFSFPGLLRKLLLATGILRHCTLYGFCTLYGLFEVVCSLLGGGALGSSPSYLHAAFLHGASQVDTDCTQLHFC